MHHPVGGGQVIVPALLSLGPIAVRQKAGCPLCIVGSAAGAVQLTSLHKATAAAVGDQTHLDWIETQLDCLPDAVEHPLVTPAPSHVLKSVWLQRV